MNYNNYSYNNKQIKKDKKTNFYIKHIKNLLKIRIKILIIKQKGMKKNKINRITRKIEKNYE